MITLAFPWALGALLLPLLVFWLLPPHRERVPALRFPFFRRITETAGTRTGPGAVILRRTRFQTISAAIVWSMLIIAIARPEWIGAAVKVEQSARDVVLAIDISGSMDARDFKTPDGQSKQRLDAVRDVVKGFVAERDGDRMALIVFGSKAYVQAPLTEDLATITTLLDETEVGMAGPHTALGDAIGLSIRTFEASHIEQRLLILLSDGTDTASRMSPVNAAEIAADKDIEIFTIGVGDPDAAGEDRVDLETLNTVASRTGGSFFFAEDESGLREIYARIDELAPRLTNTLSYRPKSSIAHVPLLIAALTGLIALLVMSKGFRPGDEWREGRHD